MASYLQNPDYQTYQVLPYRAPNQQIVQAIASRNQYWESGAQQLKSAYQNYLGLDLSLDANKEKLDGLMKGVNENLKKVTQTDLAIGDNVASAMKIFDPIAKDDDIKYDNAVTKHYQSQNQIAQGYKNKGDGSDYNDANVAYMNRDYQKWVQSNDPSRAKDLYANRKSYTPYHDVMKEIKELEKGFKPDSTSFNGPELDKDGRPTGYMKLNEDKSIYASQYRAYMDAHLSDKAKQQLRINGVVAYGDHDDRLASDVIKYNDEIINGEKGKVIGLKHQIEELKGKKQGTNNPTLADGFDIQIRQYEKDIEERNLTNTKLKAKDYSELNKDKEGWAGQIYSSDWMDNLAKSSQRIDKKQAYSSDVAALTYFKENMETKRFNTKLEYDSKENALDRQNKIDVANINKSAKATATRDKNGQLLDENGNPVIETKGISDTATGDDNETYGENNLKQMESEAGSILRGATDRLYNTLLVEKNDRGEPILSFSNNEGPVQRKAAFSQWIQEHPDKKYVKEYFDEVTRANVKLAVVKAIRESVDKQLKGSHAEYFTDDEIKTGKKLTVIDPTTNKNVTIDLTRDDLISLKNGGNSSITSRDEIVNVKNGIATKQNFLTYKGKTYIASSTEPIIGSEVLSTFINSSSNGKIIEEKNKLLNKEWTRVEGKEDFTNPEQEALKPVKAQIFAKLGIPGVEEKDVHLVSRYKNGDVEVRVVPQKELGIDNLSSLSKSVELIGGKGKKNKDGSITIRVPSSQVSDAVKPKTFNDPVLDDIQKEIDFKAFGSPDNSVFNTVNYRRNGKNFNFRVSVRSGVPIYEVVHEESGAVFGKGEGYFSNLQEAAAYANNLSTYKYEDLIKAIRTIGGKPNYKNQ